MRIAIDITQNRGWESKQTIQITVSYTTDPQVIGPIEADVIITTNDPPGMTVMRVNGMTVVAPITILPGGIEDAILAFLDEQRKHARIGQMRIEYVHHEG